MKPQIHILSLSLALMLCLGAMAADHDGTIVKSSLAGSVVRFSPQDFVFPQEEAKLEGIVLTSLPDKTAGVLKFGSRELLQGEAVTAEALSALSFVPATNGVIVTSFDFLPVFSTGAGAENVTVGINLVGRENRPPVAENLSLTTYKNVAVGSAFRGMDPDGDPLTYKLTGKPKRGEAVVLPDGTFQYTPYQNKTGSDSVTYVAVDSYGNQSSEAKISIRIEKQGTKVTYADMSGHAHQYAAIKLAEEGVFTGEKVGEKYFFMPDSPVTRGEFVAMTVTAMGVDASIPVTKTGFADDDAIPAWAKPYATAALKAGIISGYAAEDGGRLFSSDAVVTRAEATVILNNAMRPHDAPAQTVFTDAVPVWAEQAAVNLEALDVISLYGDGTLRPDEGMSRAAAANMLYKAMEVHQSQQKKTGLLARAFNWAN